MTAESGRAGSGWVEPFCHGIIIYDQKLAVYVLYSPTLRSIRFREIVLMVIPFLTMEGSSPLRAHPASLALI